MIPISKSLREISVAPGVKGKEVMNISKDGLNDSTIMSIISNQKQGLQDPFYVLDLGVVVSLMEKWNHTFQNVKPYYAVKCNPNTTLLGTLAALGADFDCASQAEIDAVLALGVSPDRIIFANPCKAESHIKYAARVGVNLTTFDSQVEVEKIQRWHPKCALLLRLKALDESGFSLGSKYGALPEEIKPLLLAARSACLKVVGVSFHVGSAASDSRGFSSTIAACKEVFDAAKQLEMPAMQVLNIGGGFTVGELFDDVAVTVKAAFQAYFPYSNALSLMSEPGRFFAQTPFTLVVNIIGKRVRGELREYWINDGIFGSLLYILVEHATHVIVTPLACSSNRDNPACNGLTTYTSTVFGPTLDALDTVLTDYQLPELEVNDWLVFPNMGAYTSACGTNFNGFSTSAISTHLVYSSSS